MRYHRFGSEYGSASSAVSGILYATHNVEEDKLECQVEARKKRFGGLAGRHRS